MYKEIDPEKLDYIFWIAFIINLTLLVILRISNLDKLTITFQDWIFYICLILLHTQILRYLMRIMYFVPYDLSGLSEVIAQGLSVLVSFFFWKAFSGYYFMLMRNFDLVPINLEGKTFNDFYFLPFIICVIYLVSQAKSFWKDYGKEILNIKWYAKLSEIEQEKMNLIYYLFQWEIRYKVEDLDEEIKEELKKYFINISDMQMEVVKTVGEITNYLEKRVHIFHTEYDKDFEEMKLLLESQMSGVSESLSNLVYYGYENTEREETLRAIYPRIRLLKPSTELCEKFREISDQIKFYDYFKESLLVTDVTVFRYYRNDFNYEKYSVGTSL